MYSSEVDFFVLHIACCNFIVTNLGLYFNLIMDRSLIIIIREGSFQLTLVKVYKISNNWPIIGPVIVFHYRNFI